MGEINSMQKVKAIIGENAQLDFIIVHHPPPLQRFCIKYELVAKVKEKNLKLNWKGNVVVLSLP